MANYIAIDGGTTNTRISLLIEKKIVKTLKYKVGAGDVRNEPQILKKTIKSGIEALLKEYAISQKEVDCVIACGMITSELGLCRLEHLNLPCGIEELASGLHNVVISEICEIPFVFVRGVKAVGSGYEDTDVMRGEETELLGLGEYVERDCLYVLPGSHSKLIYTDCMGRISRFSTELTGELMSAVASNTILNQNIDLSVDVAVDLEYLKKGYLYAKENGVNAAFFKVRILNNLFGCTQPQLYGFFKGAALCDEIETILKAGTKKVIVAGKAQLKDLICYLLEEFGNSEIFAVPDEISDYATVFGMLKIHEYKKGDLNGNTL